jgi:hypothetical protein
MRGRSFARGATTPEARERKRRTEAVAAQALSPEIILGGDGEAGVQVEAMARDGFVDERSGGLGRTLALAGVVLHILDGASLRGDLRSSHAEVRGVGRKRCERMKFVANVRRKAHVALGSRSVTRTQSRGRRRYR